MQGVEQQKDGEVHLPRNIQILVIDVLFIICCHYSLKTFNITNKLYFFNGCMSSFPAVFQQFTFEIWIDFSNKERKFVVLIEFFSYFELLAEFSSKLREVCLFFFCFFSQS